MKNLKNTTRKTDSASKGYSKAELKTIMLSISVLLFVLGIMFDSVVTFTAFRQIGMESFQYREMNKEFVSFLKGDLTALNSQILLWGSAMLLPILSYLADRRFTSKYTEFVFIFSVFLAMMLTGFRLYGGLSWW